MLNQRQVQVPGFLRELIRNVCLSYSGIEGPVSGQQAQQGAAETGAVAGHPGWDGGEDLQHG